MLVLTFTPETDIPATLMCLRLFGWRVSHTRGRSVHVRATQEDAAILEHWNGLESITDTDGNDVI